MSPKKLVAVVAIWITSVVATTVAARAVQAQTPPMQLQLPTPQAPTVVSGNDFGFRITGTKGGHAIGTLVVRQNGQWVDADLGGMSVKQLSLR